MKFWLGTHQVRWLSRTSIPLFISRRRLSLYKTPPVAKCSWALDSGGFSELSLFGRWQTTISQYVEEVLSWQDRVGRLEWAAIQDWMCEPGIRMKTRKSTREHQERTVQSYLDLVSMAPQVHWVPVLQGWHHAEYLQHLEMYRTAGVDLTTLPLVGLGSVCRRQDTNMAEYLIRELHDIGVRLHGFGFKLKGLARVHPYLDSADSMAWSLAARRDDPLPQCKHTSCANCMLYAMKWRRRVVELLG